MRHTKKRHPLNEQERIQDRLRKVARDLPVGSKMRLDQLFHFADAEGEIAERALIQLLRDGEVGIIILDPEPS